MVLKAPTAAPVASRREKPIDLFGPWRRLNERIRQIDWRVLYEEGLRQAAAMKEEDKIVCSVRVVDDDGELVRSGVVQVLRVEEPLTGDELEAGESAGDRSEKEALLRANLAESNPASFSRESGLDGMKVLVRVKADGYPPLQKDAVELRRGEMRIEIKLRSKPVTIVHVRNALSEEPVTGARVEIRPALEADGTRRKVVTISGEEREPGKYILRGFPQGKYDLTVESARFRPILREGIELGEELEIWAHAREKVRTGSMVVKVFGPEGKPWAETEVVARVNGMLIHRTTDKEGLCRFEDLLPGEYAFLLPLKKVPVAVARFVGESTYLVRPGSEGRATLGSPPDSAKLTVVVRDPFGAPLPDVFVRIEGLRNFIARTGRHGQAEFPGIPPGSYRLALRGARGGLRDPQGKGSENSQGGLSEGPLPDLWVFEKEIEVEDGQARREEVKLGRAVVRGRVIAADLSGLIILASSADRVAAVAPDADGRFAFLEVPPGKIVLSTGGEVAGFVLKRKIAVEAPEVGDPPEVEIRLTALGTVWVLVTDGDGKPVSGTKVISLGPQGEVNLTQRSAGLRGGEFVGLLDPGPNRLKVIAPGRDPHEQEINVRAGEKERVEVVLSP